MSFVIKTTTKEEEVASFVASTVLRELSLEKKVLLFLTGGSSISVGVKISEILRNSQDQNLLKNLTITLTDERYGEVNYPESNWYQLLQKGFSLPGAKLIPVLKGEDKNELDRPCPCGSVCRDGLRHRQRQPRQESLFPADHPPAVGHAIEFRELSADAGGAMGRCPRLQGRRQSLRRARLRRARAARRVHLHPGPRLSEVPYPAHGRREGRAGRGALPHGAA